MKRESPSKKKQLQLKKRVFPLEIPRLYLSVMIDGPQEVNVSHDINFHAFLGAAFQASNCLANYASSNAGPGHPAFSILTIQIRHLWFHIPEKVDSLSRGKYLPRHGSWKAWGIILYRKNCFHWVFFWYESLPTLACFTFLMRQFISGFIYRRDVGSKWPGE